MGCCTGSVSRCSRMRCSRICSLMRVGAVGAADDRGGGDGVAALEGLSDREAVDRFAFDVRWKYAAGGLDFDHPGFVHTVLVDMRARLALARTGPDRIFEAVVGSGESGGVGRAAAGVGFDPVV